MSDLDFSELTDDQLVGLLRSILQEAVKRHPGVEAAARAAVLDESEKAKIRIDAASREAAAMRARERERIAAEAAAKVRAEAAAANAQTHAERERSIQESRAREAEARAKAVAEAVTARDQQYRDYLTRAAALVGLSPGEISLVVYTPDIDERSVYINKGFDRYNRDHLVSFRGLELSTKRRLMPKKPELLKLCAELQAKFLDVHIDGSQYFDESEVES